MSHEMINSWVKKANDAAMPAQPAAKGVQVIRRAEPKSKGNVIIELSETIFPYLRKMFEGARGGDGMLLQPAHIRSIAFDVAQEMVNKKKAG